MASVVGYYDAICVIGPIDWRAKRVDATEREKFAASCTWLERTHAQDAKSGTVKNAYQQKALTLEK